MEFQVYSRYPVRFVKGKGMYLWDDKGKRYLDFLAGIAVVSLGHCHPVLVRALKKQASLLWHTSNLFIIPPQEKLASLLSELFRRATGKAGYVFFSNSGAEAVETALKFSRKWGNLNGKRKVLSFRRSFHGRTIGSLSLTGQDKYREPFSPLVEWVEICEADCVLDKVDSGDVAAVFLEPVQGEGGVVPFEVDFVKKLREATKKRGTLLVLDEVQTGAGRTGKFFAFEHYDVQPDIVTLAKGIGGGFPIGATIFSEELAHLASPAAHGSTFGGNYLATTVSCEVVKMISQEEFLRHVREMGEVLKKVLHDIASRFNFVKEIRGIGLMWGMELENRIPAKEVARRALDKGLVLGTAGRNTLRFVPPLIVEREHIEQMSEILIEVLRTFDVTRSGV